MSSETPLRALAMFERPSWGWVGFGVALAKSSFVRSEGLLGFGLGLAKPKFH